MELNRDCRIAEHRLRKTKLVIHHNIFTEKRKNFNKAIQTSRQEYFSNLINTNIQKPRLLFTTIDYFLNPTTNYSIEHPGSKCEEFVGYFREKIINIGSGICQQNKYSALSPISSGQSNVKFEGWFILKLSGK